MRKFYYLTAGLMLLTVWLQACATAVKPVCSHKAVYQAISFQDLTNYPVRIAIGPSNEGDHAQAQALIDGKWQWLEGDDFSVSTGYMDRVRGWKPDRYVSVEAFLTYFGYHVSRSMPVAERDNNMVPSTGGDYSSSRSIYRSPW